MPPKQIRRLQTYNIPFTDHSNHAARMVYMAVTPLPPLFVMVIYFTHPDASPDQADLVGFLHATLQHESQYRFEFFFLPGASDEDCMNHYHEEKANRGDTRVQIAAVENDIPPSEEGRLPGLVHSYVNTSNELFQSAIFICTKRDWSDGDQIMRYIAFDPSQEAWEKWKDPGQSSIPPPLEVKECPVNRKSPSARPEEFVPDVTDMFFQHLHRLAEKPEGEAWLTAVDKGWTTW